MKKKIHTMFIAIAICVCGTPAMCAAQDTGGVRVKVTGIGGGKGLILVSAGDFGNTREMAYGMSAAAPDSVECILHSKFEPGSAVYAFHDENGNFNLDRHENGTPAEGCFAGTAEPDGTGAITIALKYYDAGETEKNR